MKKFLLLFVVFFITGCTAEYNLNVDGDTIKEDVVVSFLRNEINKDALDYYVSNPNNVYFNDGNTYYSAKLIEDDDNYYLNYNYKHQYENFTNSLFARKCYDDVEIVSNDDNIILSTSDEFNCINMDDGFYLDSAKINITTDLKVLENNADRVKGNTYTWNVNDTNYTNKPIKLVLQKNTNVKNVLSKNNQIFLILIVIIIILLIILMIGILIRNKARKNNSI